MNKQIQRYFRASFLGQVYKMPRDRVQEILDASGIEPAFVMDGTPFYGLDAAFAVGDAADTIAPTPPRLQTRPPGRIEAAAVAADPMILAGGAVAIKAAAGSGRPAKIEMLAYSGGMMRVAGWGAVTIELAGLELPRQVPLLADHNSDIGGVVGHGTATVNNGQLTLQGRLARSAAAASDIINLAAAGVGLQASVGVDPLETRSIRAGESVRVNGRQLTAPATGLTVVSRGRLSEVSIVAIGADRQTTVSISARKAKTMQNRKRSTVTPTAAATLQTTAGDDPDTLTAAAVDPADMDRIRGIYRACAAGDFEDIEAAAIAENWTVQETELAVLRAGRPTAPALGVHRRRQAESGEVIEAALAGSLGLPEKFLAGHYSEPTLDAALSAGNRGASLHTLLASVCRAAGHSAPAGGAELVRAAFDAHATMRAGGFSTISLPGILSNVANKALLAAYSAVPVAWPRVAAVASNQNFKPHARYRITGLGQLEEVAPGGELSHVSLQEADYDSQISTRGGLLVISRQMLVNDDLGAIAEAPKILGRMAAIAAEKALFTLLLSNPDNFFHSDNSNLLTGADSALSIDGPTAGERTFLEQRDSNNDPVMIAPDRLLVPPALSVPAAQLINSTEIRDPSGKTATTNPHAKRFEAVTSPWLAAGNLSGASNSAWYMLCAPGDTSAIEIAFLDGRQTPTVERGELDFNVLGIGLRVYWDFGVAMRDHRGAVKSAGQ